MKNGLKPAEKMEGKSKFEKKTILRGERKKEGEEVKDLGEIERKVN